MGLIVLFPGQNRPSFQIKDNPRICIVKLVENFRIVERSKILFLLVPGIESRLGKSCKQCLKTFGQKSHYCFKDILSKNSGTFQDFPKVFALYKDQRYLLRISDSNKG